MENWKLIVECPNYEASTLGKIRNKKTKKILKPQKNSTTGYYIVNIGSQNGFNSGRSIYIHRIIATTFLEKEEHKNMVNHINGDKSDNSINNLEWITRSENIKKMRKSLSENKKAINFCPHCGKPINI